MRPTVALSAILLALVAIVLAALFGALQNNPFRV